jgi:hypothetical protein
MGREPAITWVLIVVAAIAILGIVVFVVTVPG